MSQVPDRERSKLLVLVATNSFATVYRFRGTDIALVWTGGEVFLPGKDGDVVYLYSTKSLSRFAAVSEAYFDGGLKDLLDSYEFIWSVDDRLEHKVDGSDSKIPYSLLLSKAARLRDGNGIVAGQPSICLGGQSKLSGWDSRGLIQQQHPTGSHNVSLVNTVDLTMPLAPPNWWHDSAFPLLKNATCGNGLQFVWTGLSSAGTAVVFDEICMDTANVDYSALASPDCIAELSLNAALFKFDAEKVGIHRVASDVAVIGKAGQPGSLLPKRVPDFFIVGFQKCATSSLWEWIKTAAPQANLPREKENFFFSSDAPNDAPRNLQRRDLVSAFDTTYGVLNVTQLQITGDATATAVVDAQAIRMIKVWNPMAKIVLLIRDPVERTLSRLREQCFLESRRTRCRQELHDGNLNKILNRWERNHSGFEDIIDHSKYEIYIPQLLHYFPKPLILFSEEIGNAKSAVEHFLGIKLNRTVPSVNTRNNYGWDLAHLMELRRNRQAARHNARDVKRLCKMFRKTYMFVKALASERMMGRVPENWGHRCRNQTTTTTTTTTSRNKHIEK